MQVTDKHTDEMTASDLDAVVNAGDYDTDNESSDDRDYSRDRPLINEGAFEAIKRSEKPSTAKNPLLRAGILSAVAMGLLIPLGLIFKGNMSIEAGTVASETALDENGEPVEPFSPEADELAQLQIENSELKRTMGLASQSLSQSELDELAKKNGDPPTKPGDTTTAASRSPAQTAASSPVVSRPAAAPIQSINYRSAPEPSRTTYRSPVATTTVTQRPAAASPPAKVASAAQAPTETVDPFEMRDRLSQLGNYGQPVAAAPPTVASEPKNIVTPVSQSVSEPNTQNVAYRPSEPSAVDESEPQIEGDEQYYKDAAAVLNLPVADVAPSQISETAMPILPGEMFKAKIINGVSWGEGERPQMALETIEDFAAESGAVLIPEGTRIMATVNGADESGSVFTGVSQIFMDSPLNIPADSLVIQAEDGSVLRADRSNSGGGSGLDIGGVFWGSAINAADNVIESDDSLVGDLAGGVGEAVLQDQRERIDDREEQRSEAMTPQVGVWTLTPRNVQIFVSRLISVEPEPDVDE